MNLFRRALTLPMGAEVLVAFGASVLFFVVLAAAIPLRDEVILILLWGVAAFYVVAAVAARFGPMFGVPLAIAAGLAFDSFYIPPTRELGPSEWQNWLVVAIYLATGAVIGGLAARSARRQEAAERAQAGLATELAASRARVVAAADKERRRVARDLHDGAQQRLVHAVVTLRMARGALEDGDGDAEAFVDEALEQTQTAVTELRELARGILPSVLAWGGLPAAVDGLAEQMRIHVDVEVNVGRLEPTTEASAYFVIAEALTNITKHAHAERAAVAVNVSAGELRISVEDDGIGGADAHGHGLTGLADRVGSIGGELSVLSERGRGTTLAATLPLVAQPALLSSASSGI